MTRKRKFDGDAPVVTALDSQGAATISRALRERGFAATAASTEGEKITLTLAAPTAGAALALGIHLGGRPKGAGK